MQFFTLIFYLVTFIQNQRVSRV